MTKSPFFKAFPIISDAFNRGLKSGFLKWSMGVGTVTIKVLQVLKSAAFEEKVKEIDSFNCSAVTSCVRSKPVFNSAMRLVSISNPRVGMFFPNSTASGKPTYPKPIMAIRVLILFVREKFYVRLHHIFY